MYIRVAFSNPARYNIPLQLRFTSRQTEERWQNLVANDNPDFKIRLRIKYQKSTSKLPASQRISKHIQLVNTSVKWQYTPLFLSVIRVSCQQVSPPKREKLLKVYLKYPKTVYVALIKCRISQCVSVQCISFQRARNSCMKVKSFGTFLVFNDKERCHKISYIRTPKQKLYVWTNPYTRDLAI